MAGGAILGDPTKGLTESGRHGHALVAPLVICGTGVLLAVLLALPGETITTKYVNDLFIFLDGAHRIWRGQVPNVDFHSSLGPLAFYLPAAGLGLSGTMAGAMPVGMALFVLLLTPLAAYLTASRMRPMIGVPLAIFLLLIAAVPANPGEGLADLSFAMFYNRMGWSALGLLLILYLPGKAPASGRTVLDALCAALLVLLLLYTKISYGLVGVAFLLLSLTARKSFRWSALALGMCLVVGLLVELVWKGTGNHIADLRLASQVSGGLPDLQRLVEIVLRNLSDITLYGPFALLLLLLRRQVHDVLFVGFCGATGILLIEQNFQLVGILTFGASAAVIAELLMREPDASRTGRGGLVYAGLPLLLLVLIGPVMAQNTAILGLHATLASSRTGDQIPLSNFSGIRLARLWSDNAYWNFVRYSDTLHDGAAALSALETPPQKVLVLDFVGPFSAGLGLPPARGDSPWFHWGRTIDELHFPEAETILADVDIVMDPKSPIEIYTADGMRALYASYLAEHFTLVGETPLWRIYRAIAR